MLKKIPEDGLADWLLTLMERGPLYAPLKDGKGFQFREVHDPKAVTLDYDNTEMSPKGLFFPQSEVLISYRLGQGETQANPVSVEAQATVVFGVRPCDAKSLTIMDRHFLGGDVVDPYWQARRDKAVIVGYALDPAHPPDPADFSERLGIHATDTEGSDIFMVRKDGALYLKSVTEKGEELLVASHSLGDATAADEALYDEAIRQGQDAGNIKPPIQDTVIASKLTEVFENKAFWEDAASACLGCGICTFVCPNCYCFDINDETLFREGERKRFWDACLFTDFTLEASGHNPRPQIFQRYRQKVMHKYAYHVTRYGCISCVGCGRCTRACPVNIHILSVIEKAEGL